MPGPTTTRTFPFVSAGRFATSEKQETTAWATARPASSINCRNRERQRRGQRETASLFLLCISLVSVSVSLSVSLSVSFLLFGWLGLQVPPCLLVPFAPRCLCCWRNAHHVDLRVTCSTWYLTLGPISSSSICWASSADKY